MNKTITVVLALSLATVLMADANIPMDKKAMKAKMTEIAGETSKFNKAEPIEEKISNTVLNEQKTKEDLKADIEALIDIKRGMTNDHIDALNTLYTILTKEQYQKILDIEAKHKKGH